MESWIRTIEIENYKSISSLRIDLGRINVFIGENGAGKSNILEAIALSGAASAGKLDNEFLTSRGIRVTDPIFMRSAFPRSKNDSPVKISVSTNEGRAVSYAIYNDNKPYSSWNCDLSFPASNAKIDGAAFIAAVQDLMKDQNADKTDVGKFLRDLSGLLNSAISEADVNDESHGNSKAFPKTLDVKVPIEFSKHIIRNSASFKDQSDLLGKFVIFSPENSALRTFEREGQIEPLGINGEGVLKLLTIMEDSGEKEIIKKINHSLELFGWFKGFKISRDLPLSEGTISITDRYLGRSHGRFDQRSANEGFLFVLFYFLLLYSKLTPSFLAIDNVEASLNPKLCEKMLGEIVKIAYFNNKQVLMTTHSPSVLDGMNLDDDDQRLFIVSRSADGHTKVRRFQKPMASARENARAPLRLSEAFLHGALGGLPKGF